PRGNPNVLQTLMGRAPDLNAQDKDGKTILILAIDYLQLSLAEMILRYGANPDIQDLQGDTALHLATRLGQLDFIKILMRFKADPNLKNTKGESALDLANSL